MTLKQKMVKFIKNINSIVLIIPIILIVILVLLVDFKDILFTNLSINIIFIIFTINLFLLISKVVMNSNKESTRTLFKTFMVVYIVIGGFFYFTERPQYVIEKDGKKMFAIVNDGPMQVWVEYYKGKNLFFYKREDLKFIEFYGGGAYDPIKNPNGKEVRGRSYVND